MGNALVAGLDGIAVLADMPFSGCRLVFEWTIWACTGVACVNLMPISGSSIMFYAFIFSEDLAICCTGFLLWSMGVCAWGLLRSRCFREER
jgi:hypothetical protein